jgi:hypothetical protein
MGIAVFVGLALVALVIVGFMVHGLFQGIVRLVRLSNQAAKWLIAPQTKPFTDRGRVPGDPSTASKVPMSIR